MLSSTKLIAAILAISTGCIVQSFQYTPPGLSSPRGVSFPLFSTAVPTEEETAVDEAKRLDRDRYVATNRFTVRKGREGKFEQRWATRSSRLATLPGFKYFHLMRRVGLDNLVNSGVDPLADSDPFGNYVSFTIWNTKKDFNSWRTGDAFKEAHGGTSLWAFVSTMIGSAMVLKEAPKPAFYDGLLQQSIVPKPEDIPKTVNGWREVSADGVNILPAECFVACNQFFVPPSNAVAFEQRWANRESQLKECEGFVSFSMMRRDVKAKGHGISPMGEEEPTYVSCTVWKDRESFNKWREGSAFKKAHGQREGEAAKPPAPLWSKPPLPIFYEGTMVITSPEGA